MNKGGIEIVKCPCGHECCTDYFLKGIGKFVQGSGFTLEEATFIKKACENHENLLSTLKEAKKHLDYCGYGDTWEREMSGDLESRIENTIENTERTTK